MKPIGAMWLLAWAFATAVGVAVSAGLHLAIETGTGTPSSPVNVASIGSTAAVAMVVVYWLRTKRPPE